jgi:hypothetical protein
LPKIIKLEDKYLLLRQLGGHLLNWLLRDPLVPFYGMTAMVGAFIVRFLGAWLIWLVVQVLFFGGLAICIFGIGRWTGHFCYRSIHEFRERFNRRD